MTARDSTLLVSVVRERTIAVVVVMIDDAICRTFVQVFFTYCLKP